MTIKDKESLSDDLINELDSQFFDSYHENVCEVAVENFRRDGQVATILVGHSQGEASFTRLLEDEFLKEAPELIEILKEKLGSTYSFVSEGKIRKYQRKTKLDCIMISSHNKAGDSRTTIYEIIDRDQRKVELFATGEVQDNLWNYLLESESRTIH